MDNVAHENAEVGGFSVNTEVFSGPLELLISLIEKRKLLINDISLASVTDDYIQYVARMEALKLRETSQFVVFASTLLLIKSKSLLPVLNLTEEEEEHIEDLQNRLKRYQIFKRASKDIETLFGGGMGYGRRFVPQKASVFVTDTYTEKGALLEAVRSVVQNLPKKPVRPEVKVARTVSLEEMIDRLHGRIEREFRFNFRDVAGNGGEKATVIVGFLAVLEMVKQGAVTARQPGRFTEIEIERDPKRMPQYR